MRKIIIEFILPEEYEKDYADVCPELVIEDFFGQEINICVLSDTNTIRDKTTILIKNT